MVFSQTELLVMIGVVSALLICITILTILDIKEYLKVKKGIVLEDEEEMVKEEVEIEPIKVVKEEEPSKEEVLVNNISNDEIFLEEMEDEEFEATNVAEPIIEEVKEEVVIPKIVEKEEKVEVQPVEKKRLETYEEFSEIEDNLPNNVDDVTNFEMEQERTAIISLDELLKKSDELYNDNEIVQYDDGNEPITIDEVISRFRHDNNENEKVIEETLEEKIVEPYSRKETIPFISSVYGIEKRNDALEFENTANYEKLDREKYNDFIAKLREMNEKE